MQVTTVLDSEVEVAEVSPVFQDGVPVETSDLELGNSDLQVKMERANNYQFLITLKRAYATSVT